MGRFLKLKHQHNVLNGQFLGWEGHQQGKEENACDLRYTCISILFYLACMNLEQDLGMLAS